MWQPRTPKQLAATLSTHSQAQPPSAAATSTGASPATSFGTLAFDGGALMNQGVHYVDLLRWCMGPVAEVTAVCATQAHKVEVEDTALAIVRFASGALGTIVSSTAVYPGFSQRLEITGTEGTVVVEDGRIVLPALRSGPPGPGELGGPVELAGAPAADAA